MPKITISPVFSGNDVLLSGLRKSILEFTNDNSSFVCTFISFKLNGHVDSAGLLLDLLEKTNKKS